MRFALLNCHPLTEPDPDEAPLLAALRALGCDAQPLAWDDPAADFERFDALILRATWDYARKADAFRAWLDRPEVASRLVNPAPVVRWNLDKRYLLELEAGGVPIVPTAVVDAGSTVAACAHERGWRDIVVKPAVSAGSANTKRFMGDAIGGETGGNTDDEAGADAFVRSWSNASPALVQPYLRSVEGGERGEPERAIVWFGGSVSHVIEKSRRFAGEAESVRARAVVSDAERAFAEKVLAAAGLSGAGLPGTGRTVLYARIDVMSGEAGETLLSELELVEPSLFFPHAPGSAERFARAAIDWAERSLCG